MISAAKTNWWISYRENNMLVRKLTIYDVIYVTCVEQLSYLACDLMCCNNSDEYSEYSKQPSPTYRQWVCKYNAIPAQSVLCQGVYTESVTSLSHSEHTGPGLKSRGVRVGEGSEYGGGVRVGGGTE